MFLLQKTPRKSSRDDRLRVQTLYYDASWSIDDIMLQIPTLPKRRILYAIDHRPTPQKHHCGRHVLLDTPHRKRLIAWVTASSLNRDIPWAEVLKWLGWEKWCGKDAIQTAYGIE